MLTMKNKKIILVDDNLVNLEAGKTILKPYYDVYPVVSAAKLFELLQNVTPDLILLDVEMPEIDGYEAARILKGDPAYRDIPVIFVTAMTDERSEITGRDLGAADYIYKPYSAQILLQRIEAQLLQCEQKKEMQTLSLDMYKKLLMKMNEGMTLQNAVIHIVADLVECRDDTTGSHIFRTQEYLRLLINKIIEGGLYVETTSEWEMDLLLSSAQLHDVGKISISDTILNKPAKLTEAEFEIMKTHVSIGVAAINRMEQLTPHSNFFRYAKIFAGYHHEKWNGSGYPNRLVGESIPLEGRLMALVDVYYALTSARPYKRAFPHETALNMILEESGAHFDPTLVGILMSVAGEFAKIAEGVEEEAQSVG